MYECIQMDRIGFRLGSDWYIECTLGKCFRTGRFLAQWMYHFRAKVVQRKYERTDFTEVCTGLSVYAASELSDLRKRMRPDKTSACACCGVTVYACKPWFTRNRVFSGCRLQPETQENCGLHGNFLFERSKSR